MEPSGPFDTELVRLFDQVADMFGVAGDDGYLKLVNSAWARTVGYSQEELLARPYTDIAHPDDLERIGEAVAGLAEGVDLRGFVARVVCADGSVRWIDWNASMLPGEPFIYIFGRDITDRLCAEAELNALVEEQAALRRVATLVAEGAAPSELFSAVSGEVSRLFGLAPDAPGGSAVVRFDPGPELVVVGISAPTAHIPLESRWDPPDTWVSTRVMRDGRPARLDECDLIAGYNPAAESFLGTGIRCMVGSPIVVDGQLWGAIAVGATERERLPADAEARLRDFTGLVATGISRAQAHDELGRLVRQQASLTRVATIVAEGVPAAELFAALTQEVVHALEVPAVSLVRYEPDRSTVVLASLNAPDFPVGRRLPLDRRSLSARVLETGRPARAESELLSEVGVPIVVDGDVWGLIRAAVTGPEPLRADIEASLRDFTGLVATAISKTESREGLRRVVAEQAALRRVATLVAEGAAPAEVFSSVAKEVARILDVSAVSVVRFESDTWSVVVASVNDPGFPVGSRWPLQGPGLYATVFKTGKPAQIDDSELPGPVAAAARSAGVRVEVGVPIVVEGMVWGMIAVGQRHRRDEFPAFAGSYTGRIVLSTASPRETQARLAAFTELVATAISKAQAHDDLHGLAMEQAALRRVATLVARDAPSSEVFESVATEVGKLLGTDMTVVGRYDGDGAATAIGSWSASAVGIPVGTRSPIGGHNVLTIVAETAKPARVDGYDDASGAAAEIARRFGWRSSIAAPIVVEDRLWGVMLVASQRPEPFPAGAEERLAAFTDLVATAVSNTQARHVLERVAAEQAALRRVATLVAEDAAPAEIFAAVSAEVDRVFFRSAPATFDVAGVVRFEPGPELVVVGVSKTVEAVPLGARLPPDELFAPTHVLRTGRSARIRADDVEAAGTDVADFLRHHGYLSQVASPIVVNGRRWGAVSVNSRNELPPDTEERLEKFTGIVATAIADAESSAELAASRRRIVAASDDARRRIERDLHDGAQQRLVSLALAVRVSEYKVPPEFGDLRKELSAIATGLTEALEGLQELSRGIHPMILSERGLGPALRTLARRSAIPVDLHITTDVRFAEPIEVAAYFVTSEALANAAKHSDASRIDVSFARRHGNLLLSVRDDGVGGADAARGSGIVGLNDRVEALGGRFALESPPGCGTTISVELPIATPDAP